MDRTDSPVTVRAVLEALQRIAPAELALDRDPTGLLIGDPDAPVRSLVAALDVTPAAVETAKATGAGLIVAHHPLIYHPLKTLRADGPPPGGIVLDCIRAGIAVACAHTCWDVVDGGVNDVLAGLLGIEKTRPLRTTWRESLVKVTVYVPVPYRNAVLNAMAAAGAGAIGAYDRCSFRTAGIGTFRPLPGANPFLGQIGRTEEVAEERLEMIAPESRFGSIVAAMTSAHPYEEVAYEVYPLRNAHREAGLGRIGTLTEPVSGAAFARRIREALNFDAVRQAGPLPETVRTVAVCGGAGAELMHEAIAGGADAFVTSDVRHHEFVDAAARGFWLIDAGHAATETPGARELGRRLGEAVGLPVTFAK
ncbi:MAG: Nif3-like dinuclear metal center hexameric protein [Capsulimonadales bacterium]|nr:Nif3-like dinuclear metal center hexameric protein [Capsulimonadales bacterium]